MIEALQKVGDTTVCPAAVVIKNGKVLMGYRHYTPDKWKKISVWVFPGGRCEAGETVEAALRREIKEEAGITDVEFLSYLGELPGAKQGDIVLMFACSTLREPRLMEPEKFSEWRWFGLEELPENFINLKTLDLAKQYISHSL